MHFRDSVQTTAERLQREVVSHIDAESFSLVRMAKHWEYWAHAYRDVWAADTENFIDHHFGYQAIAWVDQTSHARWVVPQPGNAWLQDRNLAANEQLAEALTEASNDLQVTLADAKLLPDDRHGLFVCVPTSREDKSAGYIVGIFDVERFLDALLERHLQNGHSIIILSDNRPIYQRTADGRPLGETWSHTVPLDIRDTAWRLQVTPSAETLAASQTALPLAILVAGTLVALLLGLSVHFVQKAIVRARQLRAFNETLEQRVADRTSQLARAKIEADAANRAKSVFLANMS
ncbi:MAG: hypothetical protein WD070_03420, partial [Pirellulaceae bacterium]